MMQLIFRRPPLAASLATLCAVGILCALGLWQVHRAQWKTAILARMDAAFARDPMSNPLETVDILRAPEFESGVIRGTFLNDKEIALGPRTHAGVSGGHILTPFKLQDGAIIFVNRGWVPPERKDASSRPDSLVTGPTFVAGVLRTPERPGLFVPENDPAREMWYRIDLAAMAAARALPAPLPKILYTRTDAAAAPYPVKDDLIARPPDNHRAYAAFWFTMALTLAFIFLLRFVVSGPNRHEV